MNDDQSEMVSCPFNSAHTIERRRLQAHIIKCKRVNSNFFFCGLSVILNRFSTTQALPANHDYVQ